MILDKIKRLFRKPKPRPPTVIKSVKSGDWNAPSTWDIGQVPGAGDSVRIREGHTVIYGEPE